jgi:uncharacterized repeat protein (TIGR03803 family)
MRRISAIVGKCILGGSLPMALLVASESVHAASEKVLYAFQGGKDGFLPAAGVIADSAGNLYGTTYFGGRMHCGFDYGCGTFFKLAPDGSKTTLHVFCSRDDCRDGVAPSGGLIADKAGNLYGTTYYGGRGCPFVGCGTVFIIAPDGSEKVLYDFKNKTDGKNPAAGVVADSAGNLYGTTSAGGIGRNGTDRGTVFKLAADGTETVLHTFCTMANCADGWSPQGGMVVDKAGNLYGTTMQGGVGCCSRQWGYGLVFKLAPDGSETVLHAFTGPGSDGDSPDSGLIADKAGNLYGTTPLGGPQNGGTIFRIAPDGTETELYSFCAQTNCADGATPQGGLLTDAAGNFYGAAAAGGSYGWGAIFKLAPDGTETVLYAFTGDADGLGPTGNLISRKSHLLGTTGQGGHPGCGAGCGTVFEIRE